MTSLDFIKSAMRLCGALASGEDPEAEEANDALMVANQMLDSWTVNRLLVWAVQRYGPFNLVSGQQAYYLGPAPPNVTYQLMSTRPVKVERIGIINLANPLQPLELPLDYLTTDKYADIPVKNIQGALPTRVYDDQGFPYRTLYFWVVPNIQVQTAIYAWVPISQFPDLNTDVEFPPAYAKAIRYNLAVDLAPELMGQDAPPSVMAQAISSKAEIENMNAPSYDLTCDPMLVNPNGMQYNWISDTPARR